MVGPSTSQTKTPTPESTFSGPFETAWRNHLLATTIPNLDQCCTHLATLKRAIDPEVLESLLPSPNTRPFLAAAVVIELSNLIADQIPTLREQLIAASPILQILARPYMPLVSEPILELLGKIQQIGGAEIGDILPRLILEGPAQNVINSTLRDLLLAIRLNQTVLRGSEIQAYVQPAQYSWRTLNANTSLFGLPDLPIQCEEQLCL
jgi:hypothetical protein